LEKKFVEWPCSAYDPFIVPSNMTNPKSPDELGTISSPVNIKLLGPILLAGAHLIEKPWMSTGSGAGLPPKRAVQLFMLVAVLTTVEPTTPALGSALWHREWCSL
jgi:hypothetical protein